jgi:hypothetical protein
MLRCHSRVLMTEAASESIVLVGNVWNAAETFCFFKKSNKKRFFVSYELICLLRTIRGSDGLSRVIISDNKLQLM